MREVLEGAASYYLAAFMTEGPMFPDQKMKDRGAEDKISQSRSAMKRLGRKHLLIPSARWSLELVSTNSNTQQ
jgi:hypothetical protein